MTKYCVKCKIKIKESKIGEILGERNYVEFMDGEYCLDCADDLKRRKRKE
jgi:hypothetical protein